MTTAAIPDAKEITLTEEQLLTLPHIGKAEVIDGRMIVAPAGFEHGGIAMTLGAMLWAHVRGNHLGMVFDSSTGFWMRSGNLLSPDVSFVAAARLKGMKRLPRRFFRGSPDLVAEVLSPNDTAQDIERKILEYTQSDTRLMWIVDAEHQTIRVVRAGGNETILRAGETVSGENVAPGFELALNELFAPPAFD